MIIIDKTLVSNDVIERKFTCEILSCKGGCCVKGDIGAPLELEEAEKLKNNYKKLKKYISEDGFDLLKNDESFVKDENGVLHTPLINDKECAYIKRGKNDIVTCGIENAYNAGEIDFNKPISCHLYPLRITELKNYTAVNYHDWDICNSGCVKGENDNVYVFEFLKSALIRKFGNDWYEKLLTAKKTNS